MPLIGPELILLILILILLFRSRTIKDLASALGRLAAEFRGSEDREMRSIVEVAEKLGIDARGMSEEELLKEIRKRISR